ncbi:M23 family metallopeptidase [Flavobacterium luminosum]|uniref:M23 family metallopeptidase n=1 Tax=Flavobacterium luminosum TaxID=2949086 RepID=UPI00293F70CF|nr:M23 family metallopeptidase [Flavobacterium sp. HXWNR70]
MRILGVFLFFFVQAHCQNNYPKDYFRSPMDIPLSLSGSFGELRPNHFHAGIDFRTQKKEGLPVYAAADGYISRIKISTTGLGKCIYIDHPNGFTTVYGHLQKTSDTIQAILNKEHYLKQKYEIEIFPKANEILVKKGELIAYSGNTGSSGGPHLHFEIRDTKTENIINPLFFGFGDQVKDNIKPQLNGVIAYALTDSSSVNGSLKPVNLPFTLQKDGSYTADKVNAMGKIGFALNAFDTSNDSYGKNGIHKLEAFINGTLCYSYEFDTFSFDETRYINDFIDYPRYKQLHQRYQKLFVGHLYPSIIKTIKDKGILDLSSRFNFTYKVVLEDFHGNKTVINIPVAYDDKAIAQPLPVEKTPYFLNARKDNAYAKDGIVVFFPEDTFYSDFFLKFDVVNKELLLHDDKVAVNNPFQITFDVSEIPTEAREKMFIANLVGEKTEFNYTFKKENQFSIKTKKLGKFFLSKDETAPKIYAPNFKEGANLDTLGYLKISISDDLSGIKEYNAYLNGKWILMEYEPKLKRLTHNFSDDIFDNGKNDFTIEVKDQMGNVATFQSHFFKTKK